MSKLDVYPACAGIDLFVPVYKIVKVCLPRMRGDRPSNKTSRHERQRFTPHARGSTRPEPVGLQEERVYPACAGIDPSRIAGLCNTKSLPRMRGDRPLYLIPLRSCGKFTPHARGSTLNPW